MTYALAAAGTGGHVFPALAVADALVASGVPAADIVFFGGERMEATTVPAAGYPFVGMPLRGLNRSLTPRHLAANAAVPGLVVKARRTMIEEMRRRGVKVLCVFGGYVSGPAALAARSVGATVFLHEQNAIPGMANRMVGRLAETSFVGFPGAAGLPRSVVVGNPVREALRRFDRDALRPEALARYDLPGQLVVLGVVGGSLGAKVLNDVTLRIADDADPDRVAIVHLTGELHHGSVESQAERSALTWRTVPFEDRMDLFYAAADLVLSRAGALTVAELTMTGTPAVIVPYAAGTAGHQAANADHLAAAGGAVVVRQDTIDAVPVEVQQLLVDAARRSAMGGAAGELATPDAADRIAAAMVEAATASEGAA